MSRATDGLQADRDAVLEICAGFSEADWAKPSGCPGWSVKDVVAHLGALFWMVVDPSRLPDAAGLVTEQAQEVYVEARRSLSAPEVLADYEAVSTAALKVLASFEAQDFEVPLGDLGTYPVSMVPTAYCFDHFVHIRDDLFSPRGPLTSQAPPCDELRVAPALDWIEAALPQQNQEPLRALPGAVEIGIAGPGARTIKVGSGDPVGHVSADASAFVRCVTQRMAWDDADVRFSGSAAAREALRGIRVF